MKFRYYITDIFDGCVKGTDSEVDALEYSACEEYFVVDTETGMWLTGSGEQTDIQQMPAVGA